MTTLTQYTKERRISPETLAHFGLEEVGDEVAIPYPSAIKYRRGWDPGERKFRTEGKPTGLFNAAEGSRPTVFLVEGETDTMRLWQELPDHEKVGVVGLSGLDGWSDRFAAGITAERVFVILDNDQDYAVQVQSDRAWDRIRTALGDKAKRVRLPSDCKDVCEFFDGYNLEALRIQLERSLASRFKTLDLRGDPPPTRWLVRGLIARGDVHLLFGEPTVGKSWLTLELSVAVANHGTEWLGARLSPGAGRVLYVDEENPADVVLQRLRLLGLTDEGAENVRYLHHQRIKLDRNPLDMLDEAKSFKPDLIVLDSLAGVSNTTEENSATEVRRLFENGFAPLARETDAAVIVIHHVNKTDSGSSFKRVRGSGDMTGAPDTAFDVRLADQGSIYLDIAKSRRVATGRVGQYKRVINSTSAKHEVMEAPF